MVFGTIPRTTVLRSYVVRGQTHSNELRVMLCDYTHTQDRQERRIVEFSFLPFDHQEAFHCSLVVACVNKINMISIQCHRVGQ